MPLPTRQSAERSLQTAGATPGRHRQRPAGHLRCWLAALLLPLLLLAGCQREAPKVDQSFRAYLFAAGEDGEVRVINAIDLTLQAPLRVGLKPTQLIFNPARNELYSLNEGSRSISVIDVVHLKVVATLRLPGRPTSFALSANGATGYVAVVDERDRGQLIAIDLPSRAQTGSAAVGSNPSAVAVNATGDRIVVANQGDNTISILESGVPRLLATVAVGQGPTQVTILPWGHKAFVLCPAASEVSVVDLQDGLLLANVLTGKDPRHMLLKPDGGELYVANFGGGDVTVIDTTANQVSSTILAGQGPLGMAVTPDNATLFIANSQSNSVSEVRLYDRKVLDAIAVGRQPEELQLGPFGQSLYVGDIYSNDIAVVRTDMHALLTLLPAAPRPTALRAVWYRRPPGS